MSTEDSLTRRFLAFSSAVTAFSVFDLHGTGQAECYLSTVVRVVGQETLTGLLDAYERAAGDAGALREEIFSDEKLGPVARNIVKLWYTGVWYELPPGWTERFGARESQGTFTASSQAYPEGLLWRAIGANPPGAKAPGYGSWARAPLIPPIPGDQPAPVLSGLVLTEAGLTETVLAGTVLAGIALSEVPRQRVPEEQPLVTDRAKETMR
jgi:hypothetical protein